MYGQREVARNKLLILIINTDTYLKSIQIKKVEYLEKNLFSQKSLHIRNQKTITHIKIRSIQKIIRFTLST